MTARNQATGLCLARRLTAAVALPLLLALLSSCGGGGGGGDGGGAFEILSGGTACGGSCNGDSSGGSGVGSGSDGGDGAGGSLSAMRNVTVVAKKPDGTLLGSAPLENNLVSIYPNDYQGPFILEFTDGTTGTGEYFDEAKGAWLSIGGQSLHILVPQLTHHISANAFTEAAYQRAIKTAGSTPLTAASMRAANGDVLKELNAKLGPGYQVTDITNFSTPINDQSGVGALPDTHAGRYGAVIAALALAAQSFDQSLPAPALSFVRQFAADIVDDGSMNDSAAVDAPAYGEAVGSSLDVALTQVVTQFGSPDLPLVASAAGSFTLADNPNGVWTYGETAGFGGAFTLFTAQGTEDSGLQFWIGDNADIQTPRVYFNPGNAVIESTSARYDPQVVGFHPGRGERMPTFRFTTPVAGRYEIVGSAFSQDVEPTSTQVGIFVNGEPLGDLLEVVESGVENGVPFTRTSALKAGDTVDLSVGNNGNFLNDSTGLIVTIRAVP